MIYKNPGDAGSVVAFKSRYDNYIGGEWTAPTKGQYFENISPVNGKPFCEIARSSSEDIEKALDAAHGAAEAWGKTSVTERANILNKIADRMEQNLEMLAVAETWDNGKAVRETLAADIPLAIDHFRYFAGAIRAQEGSLGEIDDNTVAYHFHEPLGVVGQIIPWNFPILMAVWKLAPALAAGNCVILKPAEQTPASICVLLELVGDLLPAGVLNVVQGFGVEAGKPLAQSNRIAKVAFTGETTTGEIIMKSAAKGIRDISLELGGKNAGLVFADCDMDKAIEGTMRSAFVNCGQVCLGTERVYVERSIFDEFVSRLKEEAEKLRIGPPDDDKANFGPLVSLKHREKVLSYYQKAVEDGATVVTGGGVPDMPEEYAGGAWVQPTIWTGLSEDSAVVTDEIFGPCCHICPFDTEEEAIELANRLPYGLASAIWTENVSRAHRVAGQVEAGIIWVNSWFLRDLRTPFGGSKQSGIGREGGVHSLEFYTEMKNVCIKL
jgi:2-hydroxymuconic semialdehyde dehydrogenase